VAFRDLDELLDVPPLVLPIRGKEYSFPGEISARSWLRLQRLSEQMNGGADADDLALGDEEEAALEAEMFGGLKDELIADGLTGSHIRIVFYTLIAFHLSGRTVAETVWNNAGEPPAPNREARRSKTPATSTRSRGSRAGSKSPSKSRAKPRPGAASSPAGRS
jgi:hypothetical protein